MIFAFIAAIFSGALLPFAFAPFYVYSLAFILPAILLFVWLRSSPTRAFWTGWFFGVGFFGVGTSWIYISISQFGNAPPFLAGLITLLFVFVFAFYPATLGYIFRKFFAHFSDSKNCLLIFPVLWVLWEWLRSILFTGFPWVLLGYAPFNTPLKGWAPLIGVYGISLLTVIMSGALVLLATRQFKIVKVI